MIKSGSPLLVSIGYEQRTVEELIDLLKKHRVKKLLDVRELPLSRRKGFSKTALSLRLADAGIEYLHLRAAGNPYRHEGRNPEHCLQLYKAHLRKNPKIVETVADEITRSRIATLCYERQHARCHRSILVDALIRYGYALAVLEVT
jgi:uncharacterized protein (DUF488 family)